MLGLLFSACLFSAGAVFPYDTALTPRYAADSVDVGPTSPIEIPAVDGGMPLSDSVAVISAGEVDFDASLEDDLWQRLTNAVGAAQAALAMKRSGDSCHWICYSDGQWRALSGAVAEEGVWDVRVELDYSLGLGDECVRYLVRRPGKAVYTALVDAEGETWLRLGDSRPQEERRIEKVQFYGGGSADSVVATSGPRQPSGSFAVSENQGEDHARLVLEISAEDVWGVEKVTATLTDRDGVSHTEEVPLAQGGEPTRIDLSDYVSADESYVYALDFIGSCRGQTLSLSRPPKDLFMGLVGGWFSFADGLCSNAVLSAVLVTNRCLRAAQTTPKGLVAPLTAAPRRTVGVVLESSVVVAGAVHEASLLALDAAAAQTALTVVRFFDGTRGWACRKPDGEWVRLYGAAATNGTYGVRMELDYKDGRNRVAYSLSEGADYALMEDASGVHWFGLPPGVSVMGEAALLGGDVARLSVVCKCSAKPKRGMLILVK